MLPWVPALSLVVTVMLLSVASPYVVAAALFVVWVVLPFVVVFIRSRVPGSEDADADTHYWRMSSFLHR
jgi:hypothetical protein